MAEFNRTTTTLCVSVGSANFDNRSFRLNDEANLNVFDREFAREESAIFDKDKLMTREVTWEDWKRRSILRKVSDATVMLLRSQTVSRSRHAANLHL